jgi:hypothetical protein
MRQITGTRALGDNPVILSWPKKIGELFPDTKSYCDEYQHDTTAWCGLTVGYCMATSGVKPVFGKDENSRFLWALAWKEFGTDGGDTPRLGDVLVFQWTNGGHHVTLFEQAQGDDIYVCRGGNQNHQVKLSNFPKRCCIAVRRPPAPDAAVKVPANVVQAPAQMQSGIIATTFGGASDPKASTYDGHVIDDVELGVALPSRIDDPRPNVRVWKDGNSVICKVVRIGPWNTDDPYWQTGTRPKAEAGIDSRKTNGAGIDLTPAAAHAVGLQDKGVVDWEFIDGPLSGPIAPEIQPGFPNLLQYLESLLEAKMPANPTTTTTTTSTQPDLAAFIQQVLALMQTIAQVNQPQTPSGQQGPTADTVQQFIKLLTAMKGVAGPADASGAGLGPVNGALGEAIGNLLNGKKSAIGIIGAMLTAVLQAVGPSLPTVLPLVGSFAGLGQAALPIFLAIAAWGALGKLEKLLPPATQPKQ